MSKRQGRVMAIDYGLARIGVAISDPLRITARGIETISWNGLDSTWAFNRIVDLCKEHAITELVMGLPKRTDGKESSIEAGARLFGEDLQKTLDIPLIFQDERYTTVIASRILNEVSFKKQNKRKVIDQVAAEIILQSYLDKNI